MPSSVVTASRRKSYLGSRRPIILVYIPSPYPVPLLPKGFPKSVEDGVYNTLITSPFHHCYVAPAQFFKRGAAGCGARDCIGTRTLPRNGKRPSRSRKPMPAHDDLNQQVDNST